MREETENYPLWLEFCFSMRNKLSSQWPQSFSLLIKFLDPQKRKELKTKLN